MEYLEEDAKQALLTSEKDYFALQITIEQADEINVYIYGGPGKSQAQDPVDVVTR